MYQRFGDELLFASSDDPDVSIYAARRTEDDALTLMLVNLGPEEKRKPLVLHDVSPTEPVEVWLFDADHNAEKIGTKGVPSGEEIVLPPQSISLYVFP